MRELPAIGTYLMFEHFVHIHQLPMRYHKIVGEVRQLLLTFVVFANP